MQYMTASSKPPPYLMYPRFLMSLELSDTAKLLYIHLLDRARVSQRTPGWSDEWGRVFLHYPIRELARTIHHGETMVKAALADLEKAELIRREREGIGKPNRIYVRIPDGGNPTVRQAKNRPSDGWKTGGQTGGNPPTNKNNRIRTMDLNQRRYDCSDEESL